MARQGEETKLEETKVQSKPKGTDEVVLVDKYGNQITTTKAFYDQNKEAFDTAEVTLKK